MRRIVWLGEAQHDLTDIDAHLTTVAGPEMAASVLDRIMTTATVLSTYPALGAPSATDDDVRELVVTGLPYLLPYTAHPSHIEILRVFHDAQARPQSWQDEP